ncbi:hypothetical protein [Mycobacterium sp. DL440]|uniref:hypothetical protein n=1 Tax=Mycobacterium sp. DL440 TaxID=2675523 RepID=UPI0014234DB4|nr:hypothetical protein [Mycobacterium sp. DL440]
MTYQADHTLLLALPAFAPALVVVGVVVYVAMRDRRGEPRSDDGGEPRSDDGGEPRSDDGGEPRNDDSGREGGDVQDEGTDSSGEDGSP